jgi:diguanylate cyclase (GGDEF)-like protein
MRYTGRIVSMLVLIPSSFAWFICSTYLLGSLFETWSRMVLFIIFEFVYFIVGLRIGKAFDKAIYYSEKDTLTGAYNRRYTRIAFPKMLRKLKKNKGYLGVIVIDIDHFKTINDVNGHNMGDKVLVTIASTLKKAIRPSDIIARWGGDEFILLISGIDKSKLHSFLNRLSIEIENLNYLKEIKGQVSASIGVAIYPSDAETFDNLISIADRNMYDNKKQKKLIMRKVSLSHKERTNSIR